MGQPDPAPAADILSRRRFDRRLYAAVAIVFPLIVLVGFGRTYYARSVFASPPLPSGLVHVHGLVMTAWVALFVAQVRFIAAGRVRLHQRLGYASVGLAALIIATGIPTALRAAKFGSTSTPPDVPPLAFLAVPLFDLVMFAVLFGAAIAYRRQTAAHKRLMLLTAINFLPPAIARIPLPALQALGPAWFFGLPTVLAALVVAVDARRHGRVNRVFLAGALLLVASYVGRLALMTTGPWLRLATWMTGLV